MKFGFRKFLVLLLLVFAWKHNEEESLDEIYADSIHDLLDIRESR